MASPNIAGLSLDNEERPVEAVQRGPDTLYPKIRKLTDLVYELKKHYPDTNKFDLQGTVKLHGTHADIVFDSTSDNIRLQSRNQRDLQPEKDNCGFAAFVRATRTKTLLDLRNRILERYQKLNPGAVITGKVVVCGEWCGTGVQKKVAICNLPKFFAIISIKVSNRSESRM